MGSTNPGFTAFNLGYPLPLSREEYGLSRLLFHLTALISTIFSRWRLFPVAAPSPFQSRNEPERVGE
jgi:hypothetical protein